MKKIGTFLAIIYCLTAVSASADDGATDADEVQEIVLWHYRFDWGNAPAYFVAAPNQMRVEFADGVSKFLVGEENFCDPKYGTEWVCASDDYVFFRAVSGNGKKTKDGVVCSKKYEIPAQKYYSARMLATHAECVELIWHDDEREYAVYTIDEI